MKLENTEITKYTFSGHDSFQCRQLWLKKGYDYVQQGKNINDEDAVVKLGVRNNMVSTIRFWLKAFSIIDNKDIPTEFDKRLEDISDFTIGILPYDKYKGHSKELIENKEFHSDVKLSDEYKPLIKGENNVPYYVDEKENDFTKYDSWLGAVREERLFTEPRVIVRQIISGKPPKIYVDYTDKALYFTQIDFSIIPKSHINVFELTDLLNSKLMNFYYKYLFLDIEKELFRKILIENCKLFPCKQFKDCNAVKEIIEKIITAKSSSVEKDTFEFETDLDKMIYELYDLNEEEIKFIEGK